MKTLSKSQQKQVQGGIAGIVLGVLGGITATVFVSSLGATINNILNYKPG